MKGLEGYMWTGGTNAGGASYLSWVIWAKGPISNQSFTSILHMLIPYSIPDLHS